MNEKVSYNMQEGPMSNCYCVQLLHVCIVIKPHNTVIVRF